MPDNVRDISPKVAAPGSAPGAKVSTTGANHGAKPHSVGGN